MYLQEMRSSDGKTMRRREMGDLSQEIMQGLNTQV